LSGFIGTNVSVINAPCNVNCSFITSLTSSQNITLTGNINVGGNITSNSGFNANNYNVTANGFLSNNANTRTITMGSGTWTLTGSGTVWDITDATNLTLNSIACQINLTSDTAKTFIGGGQAYYGVLDQGGTAGVAGDLTIVGNNTFSRLTNSISPCAIKFKAGSNNSFYNFLLQGTSGNLVTITSDTAAQHTLTKIDGGTVQVGYCSISYSNATPTNTWYAAP
jgi:hypothetical protein